MDASGKFGYTETVMGGSSVPYNISADVVQVWFDERHVELLCDADVCEVERRYGLPFRGDAMIMRREDGVWGVTAHVVDVGSVW